MLPERGRTVAKRKIVLLVVEGAEESWQYGMQDCHSLERGSNLAFVELDLAGELETIGM
ncbi:hypothetical protein D2E25_1348 [Bifidobacterium goeldii]|uniref:Uncharacterized protein n=1 Tax=Bifidobacterium goeldii TaxID=2306975 RepID=A0A430FIZ8_9BIFI|nr:hypothetical protein D2E25_1348 [Bifidobacterium goeldii]